MCLAIPGKVLSREIHDGVCVGRVQFGGVTRQTCLDLVPEAAVGDYVIVHVGFGLSVVDRAEAERTWELLESMGLIESELGPGDDDQNGA
jgi:hydrogenase expression/formation protein HypC